MDVNLCFIAILVVAAYLLGSIPSAVWIGKRFYGIDVREHGSHNAGTTNTLRVLGGKAALPVFSIDVLKGFVAVSLAHVSRVAVGSPEFYNLQFALVAAAILGHMYPIFASFKGGKGVATLMGAMFGISVGTILLCLLTFAVIFALTRYVSLGSMSAGILAPIYARFVLGITYTPLIIFYICVALLLIYTHRQNIKRLIAGNESKTYFRKQQ